MYRLLSPSQLLHKAGKQGLIAIQKQVTKKGKTFTQTFYVKPESVPKDLDKLKQVEVPEREVIHISGKSGDFELESNRPEGGFFLVLAEGSAVRVPNSLIEKVIKLKGHTFVLHRTLNTSTGDSDFWNWTESFRVSELSTGLSLGLSYETIEDTEKAFKSFMVDKSEVDLDRVIGGATKVADIEEVMVDTDDLTVHDVKQRVADEDIKTVARDLWMNYMQYDEDIPEGVSKFTENLADWMTDVVGVKYNTDIQKIIQEVNDGKVLKHAVKYNLEYYDAFYSLGAIDDAMNEIVTADMDTDIVYNDVLQWAHDYEDDLVNGYDPSQYGVSDNYGDEKWSPAEVLKHAIEDNMDLHDAQYEARQEVEKNSDEEEPFEDISITDAHGKHWKYDDIQSISEWVGGVVQTTRNKMKMNDESRRRSIDLEKLKGLQGSTTGDQIIDAVERHLVSYHKQVLYRGTKNPAWLTAEVGQIVQMGLASFSKDRFKAEGFTDGSVVLVMDTSDKYNPVVGVDIDNLIYSIRDAGYSKGLSRNTSFDAYDDEKEFMVRTPSIEITKIEEGAYLREHNDMGLNVKRVIYIKPTEMSMVQFIKALFEDNTLAMERTFDFNLHREPEDAWN